MKKKVLIILALSLIIGGALVAVVKAQQPANERANVRFNELVRLRDVFLRGDYVFVHDEEKMANGEDCTWVYDTQGKFVTSFHCTPVDRPISESFKVVVSPRTNAFDLPVVREIQFAGSTEGHQVP